MSSPIKKTIFLLIFFSCSKICIAQNISNKLISEYEDTLAVISYKILNEKTEFERYAANKAFITILKEILKYKKSFEYPFDSLPTISRIYSPDKSFRIFNWLIKKETEEYEYFCIVQVYNKSRKEYDLISLKDDSKNIRRPEEKKLDKETWYGAYYYDIIHEKKKGRQYYILLGKDFNNQYSSKKLIEVMYFAKQKINFGAPIFNKEKKKKHRVIIEYNNKTSISLRHQKKEKQIIFDHLTPIKKELKGLSEYYVPDGSFDAYKHINGKWIFHRDIDVRNDYKNIQKGKPKMGLIPR